MNNNLTIRNTNFQRVFSILFYNQINLHLKSSFFWHGLSGIIYKKAINENNHITIRDEIFQNPYKPEENSVSISIVNCIFDTIQVVNPIEMGYLIRIDESNISVYITHCYFNNFVSTEGVIRLDKARCLTITHICASNVKTGNRVSFLYQNCVPDDFSFFLYSSIVNTGRDDNSNDANTIYCINGDHYYRCNNMTKCYSTSYHFVAPICFSFEMNTVIDCDCSCIEISGYNRDNCPKISKYIKNVNFFSKGLSTRPVLFFDLNCNFDLFIENSVLLSQTNNLLNLGSRAVSHLTALNCIICKYGYFDNTNVKFENCETVSYDYMHLTIFPHYTYSDACEAPIIENNHAVLGCNAGNCIDFSCNKTIKFPEGVPQYTTILYTDINTPTLTSTKCFSKSFEFSKTDEFTNSYNFDKSDGFHKSQKFTNLNQFTYSSSFTNSKSLFFNDFYSNTVSEYSQLTTDGDISYSMSFVESLTYVRTVILSASYSLRKIIYSCFNDEQNKDFCETFYYIESYFPYIIYSLSPTLINIYIIQDNKVNKKKLTSEQLIGIACGSAATFFSICGIILLILRYKRRNAKAFDSIDLSDSSFENNESKTQIVDLQNVEQNQNDNWL